MKKIIKIVACFFTFTLIAGGGGYFYYRHQVQQHSGQTIVDFDKARDSEFILNMFKDPQNWYWLIAEGSVFSPELMLETRGYPQESAHRDNLFINLGYNNAEPAGFVAYYMSSLFVGKILFLIVDEKFRSQGWGRRLLDYGVQELKKMGAIRVELVTRTSNEAAQRLYKRYGFKEVRQYGPGFVEFSFDVQ